MFIQSGGIVFMEVYEKDSISIKPINCTLQMKRELLSLPVVQKILLMSSTVKCIDLDASNWTQFGNANYAYGDVEVAPYYEREGDYYGYDDVQAVEPAMDEGYYSGYSSGRSQTYMESGVEVKAEFPGGEKAMNKYIKKNLNYPFRKKLKDEVIVKVALKITSEGKVEITYASSTPAQYQEYFIQEAKRLCTEMPNWSPAEHNGKKVNMEKILYITF
jgi:hypothetical protein